MATDDAAAERTTLGSAPTLDGSGPTPGAAAATLSAESHVSVAAPRGVQDPARVGRYVIIRRLGEGGMGVVFLAYDPELDRKVAIKLVHEGAGESTLVQARVKQEAQALAQVSHPNIVHVYEVGESAGQIFLAMEYVAGVALSAWQHPSTGPAPSVDQILRVYLQAAAGLLVAHRSGLVHRDFKPDNVLLGTDGRARVLDFGLARTAQTLLLPELTPLTPSAGTGSGRRLTQVGAILGTPGYMSSEQVHGDEADARSDQFSFCAALYEALYRQLPFAGDTLPEFAAEVLAGRLRPPPPNDVPLLVEQALKRGLSVDPAARYPSMQELILAIEAGLLPDSESPATRRASRRFAILAILFIIASASYSLLRTGRRVEENLLYGLGIVVAFTVALLGSVIVLRRTLLRRASSRRLVYFGFIMMSYSIASRTLGYVLGITASHYVPIETMGFAALLALEAPNASPRYGWLAALSFVSGLVVLKWPQLRAALINTVYPLIVMGSVYYRMKSSAQKSLPGRE